MINELTLAGQESILLVEIHLKECLQLQVVLSLQNKLWHQEVIWVASLAHLVIAASVSGHLLETERKSMSTWVMFHAQRLTSS